MTMKHISFFGLVCILISMQSCGPDSSTEREVSKDMQYTTKSAEALAAFEEGLIQFELGDQPKSREYFHKAIELDPEFASAYVYRSWSSGSAEEFASDAKAAIKYGENLGEGEKTLIAFEAGLLNGDVEAQREAVQKMVEYYPESARAQTTLGFIYGRDNDDAKERQAYQKAVELNPNWAGGHVSLGNNYLFSEPKDFKKAEEHMLKAVELAPQEPMAHINLGDAYRAQQNLDKALASYQKASDLDKTGAMAYLKSGHVHTLLGQYDAARENYRKAGELNENKMGPINFEAFTYLYEGNPEAALEFLNNKAMNLEEEGVLPSQMTGAQMGCINSCSWIAMHHGNADHIKELLTKRQPLAVKVANDVGTEQARANQNATIQYWEGIVAAMSGDYEAAVAKAEQNKTTLAKSNAPNKLDNYHFLQGFINMKQENYSKAIEHFEQGDKDWVYVKYWLARAHEKNGDADKAKAIYQDVADYNFNDIGYALVRKDVKEKVSLP